MGGFGIAWQSQNDIHVSRGLGGLYQESHCIGATIFISSYASLWVLILVALPSILD